MEETEERKDPNKILNEIDALEFATRMFYKAISSFKREIQSQMLINLDMPMWVGENLSSIIHTFLRSIFDSVKSYISKKDKINLYALILSVYSRLLSKDTIDNIRNICRESSSLDRAKCDYIVKYYKNHMIEDFKSQKLKIETH
jgi:hypothetical protein